MILARLKHVGSIKKAPCMTCPVMDITYQERGSTRAIKPDISMRNANVTNPFIKTNQERYSPPEIEKSCDNLPVHDNPIRL
jgi:hypothetical protein